VSGRYLLEILQAWARDPAAADCDVTLWSPTELDLASPRLRGAGARIEGRVLPGSGGTRGNSCGCPSRCSTAPT
jgi:hypothetical protein